MREREGFDRDDSILFRLSMMNLSGLFDTLQVFLTEYNYVSSLMFNPCYNYIKTVILGIARNGRKLQLLVVV